MVKNYLKTLLLATFAMMLPLVASADVEINEENFPDENFRSWVLAKDFGKDGVLTDEEIAGIKKINLIWYNLHSIKGIEFFTELTMLDCSGNYLTEADVSKCTKLTYFDCGQNLITDLDVSKNTALTTLGCGPNLLTTLDVSKNTALHELYCFGNKLTALDVSGNTELTILNFKQNQLTELDVSKNTELKVLACRNNLLTSLNASGHAKLESIRCEGNKLTTLNVSDCPSLYEVFCCNNQIRGEAMDAFIESLPISPRNRGFLMVADTVNEQNVMTKAQVAATKAKGWSPCYIYGAFGEWGYPDYEGSDDTTGIDSIHNSEFIIQNSQSSMVNGQSVYDLQGRKLSGKPARGIYIEDGKKKVK